MGTPQRFVQTLRLPYYSTNCPNSRHDSPIGHCRVSLPGFAEPLLSIGPPSIRPLLLLSDPSSAATSHISKIARGLRKRRKNVHAHGESYRRALAIGVLPDNVLLEIFDLCQENHDTRHPIWKWDLLVHVCQRWRQIVFASPHRLNLQILCTHRTPVRKNLCIWPAFPILIDGSHVWGPISPNDEANVIAALGHPDRVCYLKLHLTGSELGRMATAMQEPFPVLAGLWISSKGGNVPVPPAKFLGGSAPRLQTIHLRGIPYPTLPKLLLSTSDLVRLYLRDIPPTGYIPPEAMVACLAALPRLETFFVEFRSATPRPDRIHPPSATRVVLPALTDFRFKGASEYLECLVAQIDSPQLDRTEMVYLNQLVDFQVSRLSDFIDRSMGSELNLFGDAEVTFSSDRVTFDIFRQEDKSDWRPARTIISCKGIDWQVSHIAQVLGQSSTKHSNVIHLSLRASPGGLQIKDSDDVEWLHLLQQFSAVQTLGVSQELAPHVALALEDITGEMVAGFLPSLDSIYLAGQPASSIEKFVTARRVVGINTRVLLK